MQITTQLKRFVKSNRLIRLKRGLFIFPETNIDELVLANFIYRSSYVSLETGLNYYGIIPDVAANVTSVSPVTTRTFRTVRGIFMYSKIIKNPYFGWQTIKDSKSDFSFLMAGAEKALLDYVYIRKIRDLTDQRIDLAAIDRKKLIKYGRIFPKWVMEAIDELFDEKEIRILLKGSSLSGLFWRRAGNGAVLTNDENMVFYFWKLLFLTISRNKMRFLDLRNQLRDFTVFGVGDIRKIQPDFDGRRLVEWQNKGYIKKIVRNYYVFGDLDLIEPALFVVANKIYAPSYISLEMALAHYHLIPESVYGITSATTKKTVDFSTPLGNFIYRSLKPEGFFGYAPIPYQKRNYLMAEPEKALLDYFYLNPSVTGDNDFSELRINREEFLRQLNQAKLEKYLQAFGSQTLTKRVLKFLTFIKHADF